MNIDIPGYRIEREVGSGGMATVYLAVQESINRHIALKVMAPALAADKTFSDRFLKEARIVAELQHPNIVNVYDMGVHNHHNYIAMEYIDAGDLKHQIEQGLGSEQIFDAILDIAKALSFAHDKGYVHRDVKSENILFRSNGSAVLSDFGIAKAVVSGTKMTGTGMSIGTPHYMSPEQARGQALDGRADFYSLGIVLYEALTGKKPYDSEDTFSIGLMHINEPIPILPDSINQFQPLIDNLCAKSPDDRYSHCSQLEKDFQAIQSGQKFKRPKHATQAMKAHGQKGVSALAWGIGGSAIAASVILAIYFWQQNQLTETRFAASIAASQQKLQTLQTKSRINSLEIEDFLSQAESLLKEDKLSSPSNRNAKDTFLKVLEIEPTNEKAIEGLKKIASRYAVRASNSLKGGDLDGAMDFISKGFEVAPGDESLKKVNEDIVKTLRNQQRQYEKELVRLQNATENERLKALELEQQQVKFNTKLVQLKKLQEQGGTIEELEKFQREKNELLSSLANLKKQQQQQIERYELAKEKADELEKKKISRIPPP